MEAALKLPPAEVVAALCPYPARFFSSGPQYWHATTRQKPVMLRSCRVECESLDRHLLDGTIIRQVNTQVSVWFHRYGKKMTSALTGPALALG
jgi:hypothetical protein